DGIRDWSVTGVQTCALPIFMFKEYLYEEGERVPLIIRGPGIPQGVTRNQLVANIDLAPTIVSLTKAVPLRVMDGISLLPMTRDRSEERRVGTEGRGRLVWEY